MAITKTIKKMDVEVYTTSDGMTFTLPSQAEYHEKALWESKIREGLVSMELKPPFFADEVDYRWYLIRNKDEIEYFTKKYIHNYDYLNGNPKAKLQLGDWVTIRYDYDDGEKSPSGLLTLNYVLEQFKKFIEQAEEVTVEGKY